MPEARIWTRQNQQQVSVFYRPPTRWIAPVAAFWCGVSGAAVGVAVAISLAMVGVTALAFAQALIGTALVIALPMYVVVYALPLRRLRLRVEFDMARNQARITLPSGQRLARDLDDVVEFQTGLRDGGCALLVVTHSAGAIPLLVTRQRCDVTRDRLDILVMALDEQLSAGDALAARDELETALPPEPAQIRARHRMEPQESERAQRDLPDVPHQ